MLEDDGVDEPDDGLLVVGAGALQLAEALQEAAVVEGPGIRLVARQQVVHGGVKELGQLQELVRRGDVQAQLVLVELREIDSYFSGQLLLGPLALLAQGLEPPAEIFLHLLIQHQFRQFHRHGRLQLYPLL